MSNCPECGASFTSEVDADVPDTKLPVTCPYCDKLFYFNTGSRECEKAPQPEPAPPATCPKCGTRFDRMIVRPWGDGKQSRPVAPMICGRCRTFLIYNFAQGRVYEAPPGALEYIEKVNPTLAREIHTMRNMVNARNN